MTEAYPRFAAFLKAGISSVDYLPPHPAFEAAKLQMTDVLRRLESSIDYEIAEPEPAPAFSSPEEKELYRFEKLLESLDTEAVKNPESYGESDNPVALYLAGEKRLLTKEEERLIARVIADSRKRLARSLLHLGCNAGELLAARDGQFLYPDKEDMVPDESTYETARQLYGQNEDDMDRLNKRLPRKERETAMKRIRRRTRTLADMLAEYPLSFSAISSFYKRFETATQTGHDGLALDGFPETPDGIRTTYNRLVRGRSALAASNLRLVVWTSRNYGGYMGIADALGEGSEGLMIAVDKFRPDDYDTGFSTYATWWIRQRIIRAQQEKGRTIRLPVHRFDELKDYRAAERELLARGVTPDSDAIAKVMGCSASRARDIELWSMHPMQIDKPVGDEDSKLGDFIANERSPNPVVEAIRGDMRKRLEWALSRIPPREAEVLRMRTGLIDGQPMTLEQVGSRIGRTRERARQLETRALRKLRHPAIARRLEPFFDFLREDQRKEQPALSAQEEQ